MPVLRRIAAKGGAAGDVDDPPALAAVAEVGDRKPAEVGCGLEVDGQRALPGGVPLLVVGMIGDALIDAGIVDEGVDASAEPPQRRLPDFRRCCGIGEIARNQLVAAARGMADDIVTGGLEQCVSGRADAAARSGDEDVHRARLAASRLVSPAKREPRLTPLSRPE